MQKHAPSQWSSGIQTHIFWLQNSKYSDFNLHLIFPYQTKDILPSCAHPWRQEAMTERCSYANLPLAKVPILSWSPTSAKPAWLRLRRSVRPTTVHVGKKRSSPNDLRGISQELLPCFLFFSSQQAAVSQQQLLLPRQGEGISCPTSNPPGPLTSPKYKVLLGPFQGQTLPHPLGFLSDWGLPAMLSPST